MATEHDSTVIVRHEGPRIADGVITPEGVEPQHYPGCVAFSYFNGSTDQLSGVSAGRVVLEPGAVPHDPHRHPEEEFMIVATGTGEIVCGETTTPVGPGSMMYSAGNVLHGIRNTGSEPMTFYWSKWSARSA